jgi:hypothetical protein
MFCSPARQVISGSDCSSALLNEATYNQVFDIGGPEILTYKEMLLQYAEVRGFKRRIIWVSPFISPRFSSYWLYFVTSTSYNLAVNLVHSMKVEVVCRENKLMDWSVFFPSEGIEVGTMGI